MNTVLHLVSQLLSLPLIWEVAWGPHVAAREVPFKASQMRPLQETDQIVAVALRPHNPAPSCSLKSTFLAVCQTHGHVPTPGPLHWQFFCLQCSVPGTCMAPTCPPSRLAWGPPFRECPCPCCFSVAPLPSLCCASSSAFYRCLPPKSVL